MWLKQLLCCIIRGLKTRKDVHVFSTTAKFLTNIFDVQLVDSSDIKHMGI